MIDKWFAEDIENILKNKNRIVITSGVNNAQFLYTLTKESRILAFLMLLFSNCAQYLSFLESSRTLTLSMILNLPVSLILEWIRSLSSGLSNLFGPIMVDPAFYVFEKSIYTNEKSWFVSLDQYTRTPQEKYKKDYTLNALDNYILGNNDKNSYSLHQSKLKIIDAWPFIYWISDEFRKKFKEISLNSVVQVCSGLTGY
ncbi:MAG: hypothetical protein WBM69_11860 [Desulfobacterales bacterium]